MQGIKNRSKQYEACSDVVVDDTRLELVTSRTSSGCATSCANRPVLYQHEVFYNMESQMSRIFSQLSRFFAKKAGEKNKSGKKAHATDTGNGGQEYENDQ